MKSSLSAKVLACIMSLSIVGCGPTEINVTKKAGYSDLVVTYNAEVQSLDNLEGKRKTLIAEYAIKAQEDALKSAMSSLEAAGKQKLPAKPNDALDQAVASAELQAGLLEKLGQSSTNSTTTDKAVYPEELKRKLAELDAEIAKQKERVERARNARDAAESK
jgi:hypothetical protein